MAYEPRFDSINLSSPPVSSLESKFTISAPPKTDIWGTPLRGAIFSAPIYYLRLPLSTFRSARVTVSGELLHLYDQGGLLLAFPPDTAATPIPTRWVKLGIERTEAGVAQLSTVACDRYADWSLQTLSETEARSVTVELVRKLNSSALWAYWVVNGTRRAVREVTWAFAENNNTNGEVWIGVYVAKPSEENGKLTMSFKNLIVEDENGQVVPQSGT